MSDALFKFTKEHIEEKLQQLGSMKEEIEGFLKGMEELKDSETKTVDPSKRVRLFLGGRLDG